MKQIKTLSFIRDTVKTFENIVLIIFGDINVDTLFQYGGREDDGDFCSIFPDACVLHEV